MKKLLFCLALLGLVACNENKPANNSEEPQPQEETQYAEVAVPSGSQWAASVEVKADDPLNLFTAEEAIAQFEGKIPTKAQWEELLAYSSHNFTEQGIELTIVKKQQTPSAKNARKAPQAEDDDQLLKILLPYAGYVDCEGANQDQDIAAYLWTSTIDEQTKAMMYMVYSASGYHFTVGEVCDYIAMSVLTVEDNTVEVEEPEVPEVEGVHPSNSELLGGWRIVGNIPAYLEVMYEHDMQKYDEAPTWFLDGFENIVVGHIGETPELGFGTYMYSESLGAFTLVYPHFHEEDLQGVLTKDPEGNITFSCFKPGTEEVINVVFEKVSDEYPFYQGPVIPVEEREHPMSEDLVGEWTLCSMYFPLQAREKMRALYPAFFDGDWFILSTAAFDGDVNLKIGIEDNYSNHIADFEGIYNYHDHEGRLDVTIDDYLDEESIFKVGTLTIGGSWNENSSMYEGFIVTYTFTIDGETVRLLFKKVSDVFPIDPIDPDDPNYVDLGLPSGTKWKIENEVNLDQNNCFGLADMQEMASQVPTQSQWKELQKECTWKWNFEQSGFDVRSKINGNTIFLPAAGFYNNRGTFVEEEIEGTYWSSTPGANNQYVFQWFNPANISLLTSVPTSYSIRLVDAARDVEVSSGTVYHNLHPDERSLIYSPLKIVGAVPEEFKAAQVFGGSDEVKLDFGYYSNSSAHVEIGSLEALEDQENAWTYNETTSLLHLKCYDVLDITGLVYNGPEENQYAFMYKDAEDEPVVVILEKVSSFNPSVTYRRFPNATYLTGTWSFTGDIVSYPYIARHQRNGCQVYFDGHSRVVIGNGNYWGEGTYSYNQSTDIIDASISGWSFYIPNMHVYMDKSMNAAIKFIDMSEGEEPWVFKMEIQSRTDVVPVVEE